MIDEKKLTNVMDYIRKFSEENGYTPSVREIGKECGIKSTATVHSYIEKLQDRGYLNKTDNKKRSVSIGRSSAVTIPLIGTVTAGQPVFAYENYEDYYTFPAGEVKGEDLFMLRVQGTSMIDAGILNGDKSVVRNSKRHRTEKSSSPSSKIPPPSRDCSVGTVKSFYTPKMKLWQI